MSFAPQHDFELFEKMTSSPRLALAREASATQKVSRFAELLAIITAARKQQMRVTDVRQRWFTKKLAARKKQLAVLRNVGSSGE